MAERAATSLVLPAVFDLDALDPVRDTLLDAIETAPIQVDAARVERVATNALLMLLSAAEGARANGHDFRLVNPSASVTAAMLRLGLEERFSPLRERRA